MWGIILTPYKTLIGTQWRTRDHLAAAGVGVGGGGGYVTRVPNPLKVDTTTTTFTTSTRTTLRPKQAIIIYHQCVCHLVDVSNPKSHTFPHDRNQISNCYLYDFYYKPITPTGLTQTNQNPSTDTS